MTALRKCGGCGLEATSEEELDLFKVNYGCKHNRENWCKDCRRKKDNPIAVKRHKENRIYKQLQAIERLGGCCSNCGLEATKDNYPVFDFHHTNKDEKDDTVSSLINRGRPLNIVLKEVDKCILLCANCHRLHHHINGY